MIAPCLQNKPSLGPIFGIAPMKYFSVIALFSILAGSILAQAPAKPAVPTAEGPLNAEQEMEQLYTDAAAAFNGQKYDVALQKIGLIHTKTNNKDFEKVMFLEGACLFNMDQNDKAVEILAKFVSTFPKSESVNQAKMAMGRAYLKKGEADKGVATLKDVAATAPQLLGEAGLEIASYYKKNEKPDEALEVLETVTKNGPTSPEAIQGILMTAEIYIGKSDAEKAGAALERLKGGAAADESVVQLNSISIKIGDEMAEKKSYREALVAYQNARRKSEIIRIQKARVDKIDEWIKQVDAGKKVIFMNKPISKEELEGMLAGNKSILEEIEKNKDYDAALYYRLGQCFFEMQRFYEGALAFERIYTEFKDFSARDRSLFGMVMCYTALGRTTKAFEYCKKYLSEYPEGSNIVNITDLYGELAYKSGQIDEAIKVIGAAMSKKGADRERLGFFLGSMLFEAQRFDDSRTQFQSLTQEFPKSVYKDDAEYRVALTFFFENKSKEARAAFKNYIAGNPKGQYLVDAKYRLAFITYQGATTGQGGSIDDALDILEKLTKESPNDPNIGQVYSLLGDIYSSRVAQSDAKHDYTKMSTAAYRNAVDKAKSDDVLNYAIEQLTNLLVAENLWADVSNVWGTYYSTHKDSPLALKAIYWICRAKEKEKKVEEAQALIASAVLPHMANPANEQVEVLLQQLVTMMVPKRRSGKAPAPKPAAEVKPADAVATKPEMAADAKPAEPAMAAAAPTAAPVAAPATFAELEERLKKLLTPEGDGAIINGTAAARVLYARALLARFMKDVPKFENLISIIPDAAKAEELSPLLLSTLAEMLRKKGDFEKASAYFNRIREAYAGGEFGDKAPVGLGEIEFEKKNYEAALKLFVEAIDKYPSSSSIIDATLGKAKSLLALKKYKEAEMLYMFIAQAADFKGEPRAAAYYHLGEIAEANKDPKKAITHYNRVILSMQKYKLWLAKSYLNAAKCWEEDGKKEDAVKLLREMLAGKGMEELPEFKQAQDQLAKIAG